MDKLPRSFYLQDTLTVARDLIGTYFVVQGPKGEIVGRITETEAYIGKVDKACHAYGGKVTPRTKILYGSPGFAYVYFIYGMYHCINVVTEPEGCAACVLIRGIDIVEGKDIASYQRYNCSFKDLSPNKIKNFTNGPGKLCMALQITKEQNGEDLLGNNLYITKNIKGVENIKKPINTSKRIGIDYAEEAKDFLWRYFI